MNPDHPVETVLRQAFQTMPLPPIDLSARVRAQVHSSHHDTRTRGGRLHLRIIGVVCMLCLGICAMALATHLGLWVHVYQENDQSVIIRVQSDEAIRLAADGLEERFRAALKEPIAATGVSFHRVTFSTQEEAEDFWGVPRMDNLYLVPMNHPSYAVACYFMDGELLSTNLFSAFFFKEAGISVHMTTAYGLLGQEGVTLGASWKYMLPEAMPDAELVLSSTLLTSAQNGLTAQLTIAHPAQEMYPSWPRYYATLSFVDSGVLYRLGFETKQEPSAFAQLLLDGFVPF